MRRAVAVTQVDAIHGLGGVGKTQLAARYARLHRDDYDVIWWLRAEQPVTLRADLAALAVALGPRRCRGQTSPTRSRPPRGWLARHGRWLLVFDNVTEPAAIAELRPRGRRRACAHHVQGACGLALAERAADRARRVGARGVPRVLDGAHR